MTAHTLISPETWERVRAAYAAGSTAEDLIAASGVSRSQFYARARDEGWRRADRPAEALPEGEAFDPHAPAADPVDMAGQAMRRCHHALQSGRAGEARAWLRLHRDLRGLVLDAEAAAKAEARRQASVEVAARIEAQLLQGAGLEAAPTPASAAPASDKTHRTHTFAESDPPPRPGKRARRRARARGGG